MTLQLLQDMYLDYVNNFLSIERFAEYHGMEYYDAEWLIEQGKALNAVQGHITSMNVCMILNKTDR